MTDKRGKTNIKGNFQKAQETEPGHWAQGKDIRHCKQDEVFRTQYTLHMT